jgi:thioredoxin 2
MDAKSSSSAGSVVVGCPNCHTLNRVPEARLADKPVCAKCKSHVLDGHSFPLTESTFATHTERASMPVLVDFWAPWCGPCKMMEPVLERVASSEHTRLQVAKVNTDEQQSLAQRFGIRAIPTLILFQNGRELARQSGAMDGSSLTRWIQSALARAAAA